MAPLLLLPNNQSKLSVGSPFFAAKLITAQGRRQGGFRDGNGCKRVLPPGALAYLHIQHVHPTFYLPKGPSGPTASTVACGMLWQMALQS